MTDMRSAIGAFDAALSHMDLAIRSGVLEGRSTAIHLDADGIGAATAGLRSALGDAIPDHVSSGLAAAPSGAATTIDDIAKLRVAMGRLGAAAHAVEQLGGPSTVISAGGLDAIDGAATAYRDGLFHDVQSQIRTIVKPVVEYGGGAFGAWTLEARVAHMNDMTKVVSMVNGTADLNGHNVTHGYGRLLDFHFNRGSTAKYRSHVKRLRDALNDVLRAQPPLTDDREAIDLALMSTRAVDRSLDAKLPAGVELSTITSDPAVLAAAPAALERHAAKLQRIADSRRTYVSDERALRADFAPALDRVLADLQRIDPAIAGAPDEVRTHAASVRSSIAEFGRHNLKSTKAAMGEAAMHARKLGAAIQDLQANPERLTATQTAFERAVELLRSPGPLDVPALRAAMGTDTRSGVLKALAEHAPTLKPFAAAQRTATLDEGLSLLDEVDLLAEALRADLAAHGLKKGDPVPQQAAALARELSLRARAVLQVDVPTAEGPTLQLAEALRTVDRIAAGAWEDLDADRTLREALRMTRSELQRVRDGRLLDGGLRSLAPSARPAQARAAALAWAVRELDALPAANTTSGTRAAIDADARRVALVADMLEGALQSSWDSPTTALDATRRARSELDRLAPAWQYPDDAAAELVNVRRQLDTEALTSFSKVVPGLRLVAQRLRAWSMFEDGRLPSTDLDRLAVAARHAHLLPDPADPHFLYALTRFKNELPVLDSILGTSAPSAARRELEDVIPEALREATTNRVNSTSNPDSETMRRYADAARAFVKEIDAAHSAAASESVVW